MKQGTCKRINNPKIASVFQLNSVCQAMSGSDVGYAGVLDKYGPFLIAIAAVGKFNSYSGGVYTDAASCGVQVNHAVVSFYLIIIFFKELINFFKLRHSLVMELTIQQD